MTGFEGAFTALRRAYPSAELVEIPGGQQAVRLSDLRARSNEWTPSPLRGLLLIQGWPGARPVLLVEGAIRRNGASPPNFSAQYQLGEAWMSFSFSAPWDPQRPSLVAAVASWMERFNGLH
jgi:hypothetical protein